jgi:hypothetical protein
MTEAMAQNTFEEHFSRPSSQRKYYRDIWCLGPNGTGYPGGFPQGLMPLVLRRWNGTKKLMLFSGSFHERGWETVDIKPETKPSFVMNAEELPDEWTEKFDLVFADPPYSEEESLELYNLPYFNIFKLMNEMARVTEPGGHMIFLHRLIPQVFPGQNAHFKRMKIVGVVGIFTISGITNLRALTVWEKARQLEVEP